MSIFPNQKEILISNTPIEKIKIYLYLLKIKQLNMKTHLLPFFYFLLFVNTSVTAQLFSQKQKVIATERIMSGQYGRSVDISGNYAVIGLGISNTDALGLDTIPGAGAAYIFEKNNTGDWIQVQKIVAPDRATSEYFGRSVSISGNIAAIGSRSSYDEVGGNYAFGAGAVYIFERNAGTGQWDFVQKLVASDREQGDDFHVVAISGNNLIVGAPREGDVNLSAAGAVYFFNRNTSTGVWTETFKRVAPYRHVGDQFGYSVDIDGMDAIVGAPFDDHAGLSTYLGPNVGAAYTTSTLNGMSRLGYLDMAAGDEFGKSVAVSNGCRMVGSPNHIHHISLPSTVGGTVYCFIGNNPPVELYASDNDDDDFFGSSISIDGSRMVIGAIGQDDSDLSALAFNGGAAYIFERNASGIWNEIEKITASDRNYNDEFGNAVAISGTDILIGVKKDADDLNGGNSLFGAGSAYFFHYCPAQTSTINVSACNGYTSPSGEYYWTNSNTYTDVLWGGAVSGCDSIITINLTVNTGTVDTSITVSNNILISNQLGATWQWIDCATNQPIPGATNRSFNPGTQNGSYAVVITTNIGCVDTSACYPETFTSISTIDEQTNFAIYPNPTTGFLTVDLGKVYAHTNIELINTTGQVLLQKQYRQKEQLNLNVESILSGIYFIKISTNEGVQGILKVVKS